MPASRSARATTLMPRSWPSRPTLARTTRSGGAEVVMDAGFPGLGGPPFKSPFRRAVVFAEDIGQGVHDLAHGASRGHGRQQRRQQILARGGDPANFIEATANRFRVARALDAPQRSDLLLLHGLADDQRLERLVLRFLEGVDAANQLAFGVHLALIYERGVGDLAAK